MRTRRPTTLRPSCSFVCWSRPFILNALKGNATLRLMGAILAEFSALRSWAWGRRAAGILPSRRGG